MKFSCYKSDLNEALNFVSRAVAPKSQTPVLSGILINANGGRVELQGNNLSTGIVTSIPASVEVPGITVVSGKRFVEFVRNMPDDTLTVTLEQNILMLASGGADVNLLTMDPDDYPKVQSVAAEKTFRINMTTLGNLIRKTAFAASVDDSRPIFKGVYFKIDGENITCAATNTHRLAVMKDHLSDTCPPCEFIVPADALRNIATKFFKESSDTVEIKLSDRNVSFQFDNYLVTTRLVEGIYPAFEKIIPQDFATTANVNTAEFRTAVNFVALLAKDNQYNSTKFEVSRYGVDISAASPDVGEATQSVECQFDGEDIDVHFNVNYIADIFKAVDGDHIELKFNDKYKPAQFACPDDPNFIYIVTPVRA